MTDSDGRFRFFDNAVADPALVARLATALSSIESAALSSGTSPGFDALVIAAAILCSGRPLPGE